MFWSRDHAQNDPTRTVMTASGYCIHKFIPVTALIMIIFFPIFELCLPRCVLWTSSGYVVNNTTIVWLDVIQGYRKRWTGFETAIT